MARPKNAKTSNDCRHSENTEYDVTEHDFRLLQIHRMRSLMIHTNMNSFYDIAVNFHTCCSMTRGISL